MLIDRIIRAKQGDQEEMASLLQQFSPLLRKWGGKLLGEDGIEEMPLAFLEIIQAIEPTRFSLSRGRHSGFLLGAVCAKRIRSAAKAILPATGHWIFPGQCGGSRRGPDDRPGGPFRGPKLF